MGRIRHRDRQLISASQIRHIPTMNKWKTPRQTEEGACRNDRGPAMPHGQFTPFPRLPLHRVGGVQGKTQDSMESFAANIKRVNRELFWKPAQTGCTNFPPGYVKTRNHEEIDKMFQRHGPRADRAHPQIR